MLGFGQQYSNFPPYIPGQDGLAYFQNPVGGFPITNDAFVGYPNIQSQLSLRTPYLSANNHGLLKNPNEDQDKTKMLRESRREPVRT